MFDTLLTSAVKDFGDLVLETFTDVLYASAFVNAIIQLFLISQIVALGVSIYRRNFTVQKLYFLGIMLCLAPINKKPLYYVVVNSMTTILTSLTQDATFKVLGATQSNGNLPPGFVFNAIFKAGTAKLDDPSVAKDVSFLIDNCIPAGAKNNKGEALSVLDLFGGSVPSSQDGIDTFNLSFDKSVLEKRRIELIGGDFTSCYALLLDTRNRVRSSLRRQRLTDMPDALYKGANSGEDTGNRVTTYAPQGSMADKIGKIAVNLAEAQYYEKEVLKQYFNMPETSWMSGLAESQGAQSPLTSISMNAFKESAGGQRSFGFSYDPTEYVVDFANMPSALARLMGLDGSLDAGHAIADLNEEITYIPLKIAYLQLILKFILPIVVVLMIFPLGKQLASAWGIAWVLTVLGPSVMLFVRSLNNRFIVWALELENTYEDYENHPSFLAAGVSFDAANALVADVGKYMGIAFTMEKSLLLAFFAVVPLAGAAFTHRKVRGAMSGLGSTAMQTITRHGTQKAIKTASPVMKGAAKAGIGKLATGKLGAVVVAAEAFGGMVNKFRGPRT